MIKIRHATKQFFLFFFLVEEKNLKNILPRLYGESECGFFTVYVERL